QCTILLLNISTDEMSTLDEIESIDEVAIRSEKSLESFYNNKSKNISPELEFWGHSSNLQVWYEEDYNTNIIHSNLAFPLLKRLTEVGDPKAEKVFNEEIGKRLSSKTESTIKFLLEEDIIHF
ncbi:hypothetical protein LCGC14_2881780, partial [marine sediment metagenome]